MCDDNSTLFRISKLEMMFLASFDYICSRMDFDKDNLKSWKMFCVFQIAKKHIGKLTQ